MRRLRRRRDPAELRADPSLPDAVTAALEHGDRQRGALRAGAWLFWGIGGESGALAAQRVLNRASVTVGGIPVAEGVEVRASLSRWAGRELAHLRTWFQGRDGRWRPTRRGVTVAPAQLAILEAMVREMREAHSAGALGPPPSAARHRDTQEHLGP